MKKNNDIKFTKSNIKFNEQLLNFYFEQAIDGVFFMMLDEPVEWNDNIDKEKTLDFLMKNHKLSRVNDAMLLQYQAKREDFLNLTPADFFSHNLEKGKEHFRQFFDEGKLHLDTIEKRFDGTDMIIEGDYICLYDEEKRILGHFGVQRDVTLVREAEKKIKESEEKYRLIAENTSDGIIIINNKNEVTYCSPPFYKQLGYPDNFDLGKTIEEIYNLLHNEDKGRIFELIFNAIKNNNKNLNYTFRILNRSGKFIWREDSANFIYDENGNYNGIYITCRDITHRIEIENELRQNEEKYRYIVENISDMVYQLDLVGVFTFMSQSFTKQMGYELDEIIGHTFMHLIHPDDLQICINAIQNVILNQTNIFDVTYRIKHKNGEWRWHESNATPVIGKNGNVLFLNGIARDITKSKQNDEEIQKQFANLLAVIENIDDIICLKDLNHKVIVFNENYSHICKKLFNIEAFKGMRSIDYLPEEIQSQWYQILDEVIKGKIHRNQFEWDFGNNEIRYYEISYRPIITDKKIIGYSEVMRDITAYKLNEIKLIEQNLILIENEKNLKKTNKILDILNYLQNTLLTDTFSDIIFEEALNKFLELTESEYGFIGEIFDINTNAPYLKTKAMTNISWNEETRKLYDENATDGLEFRNLQTLFGEVIKTQKPIIANNPATHPKRGGLPEGHPALNTFLGLPLMVNNIMVGMIGVSNRPNGYDEQLISDLKPLTYTIARLIETYNSKLQLKKIEAKTFSIINSMDDIIFVLDKEFRYVEVHQSNNDDLLYDPSFFIGKTFNEIEFPEPANSKILKALRFCLETKQTQNTDYFLDLPGGMQWFDLKVTPLKDTNGNVEGVVCVVRNITDYKRKEEELIYISTQMQGINNALNKSAIVTITDLKGRIVKVNDMFCEISGYEVYEVLGKNHRIVNSGYHPKSFWKEMWETIRNGKLWRAEVCNRAKNGDLYWVDTVINPIFDENGMITQFLSIRNLITERKIAEEELRKSEENFRTLFDILPVGITITDYNGNILNSNKYSGVITGLTKNDLEDKDILLNNWTPIRPDGSLMPLDEFASSIAIRENKAVYGVEMGLKSRDGVVTWIIVNASPIPNNRIVVSYQEITKLKNALEENSTTKERMSSILNEMQDVIWSVKLPEYTTLFVSPSAEKLYNTSVEEWYNNPLIWEKFVHESDKHIINNVYSSIQNNGESDYTYRIQLEDKTIKWITNRSKVVYDRNNNPIRIDGVITDITGKKLQDKELEIARNEAVKLSNYYRDLLENQSVYVVKTNIKGDYIYVNKHFESKFGFEGIIGTSSLNSIDDEDIDKFKETIEKCLQNPEIGFNVILRKHSTHTNELFINYWEFKAVKNEKDEVIEILRIGFDITELYKTQNDLKDTINSLEERNSSLHNFAHIVSHNLRSHSANISGLISLISYDNPDLLENQYYEYLNKATTNLMESIKHLAEVAQLHTNTKKEFYPINLNESLLNTITNIFALAANTGVKINNDLDNNSIIIGEQAYIDSILLNFVTNSIKYRDNNKESYVNVSYYIENEKLVLVIEDNGLGIDLEKHRNKLFGMFKTFHEHPEARGIGLFITNNQVKALGGYIEVESEVGYGTIFKIYFNKGSI